MSDLKKTRTISEIAADISAIINQPLSKDEVKKINSILDDSEKKSIKPPKAALPKDPETNI